MGNTGRHMPCDAPGCYAPTPCPSCASRRDAIRAAKEPVSARKLVGEPFGVVLVPTTAGRALTADGPLGALPPMVSRYPDGTTFAGIPMDRWAVEHGRHAHGPRSRVTRGLPLWWDGALVREGWWRAWCVRTADMSRPAPCPVCPGVDDVLAICRELEAAGLCRVVVLDLVDGALVECAP